jgi:hypothetical protein
VITFFTPTTAAAIDSFAVLLNLLGTVLLIIMLVQRVLFERVEGARAKRLVEAAVVVIVPLLFMFALIVFFRISDLRS